MRAIVSGHLGRLFGLIKLWLSSDSSGQSSSPSASESQTRVIPTPQATNHPRSTSFRGIPQSVNLVYKYTDTISQTIVRTNTLSLASLTHPQERYHIPC